MTLRQIEKMFDTLFRMCVSFIFGMRTTERRVSELPDNALAKRILPRTHTNVVSLLSYNDPDVRAAIWEAKYHSNPKAFLLLGHALHRYLDSVYRDRDVHIVPIPLARKRLQRRGYNQCEVIAHTIQSDSRHVQPLLVRVRETVPQTTLSRKERLQNMRDIFSLTTTPEKDALIVILDDVVTTGATLRDARRACSAAGVRNIVCLAIARSER